MAHETEAYTKMRSLQLIWASTSPAQVLAQVYFVYRLKLIMKAVHAFFYKEVLYKEGSTRAGKNLRNF